MVEEDNRARMRARVNSFKPIMPSDNSVDIRENELLREDYVLLEKLLVDHSTKQNIIWATDDYLPRGEEYSFDSPITVESITGENGILIQPRVKKNASEQRYRVREKAEVFTPAWLCNAQNNLVDNQWFGSVGMFNAEVPQGWETNHDPIVFPTKSGRTWQDYVKDVRLEVACGEAPYLASRYDATTGDVIPVENRIGILDRKLRVVSENISKKPEWYKWAQEAMKSCYGYEWQGDSLLLARECLLYTFIDHFQAKFNADPSRVERRAIADIISWNLWQMDALKGVVPGSCHESRQSNTNLFGEEEEIVESCKGCAKNLLHYHNGTYCIIRDWSKKFRTVRFVNLMGVEQ